MVIEKNDNIKGDIEEIKEKEEREIQKETENLEIATQNKVNLEIEIKGMKWYLLELEDIHKDEVEQMNKSFDRQIIEKTAELMVVTEKFEDAEIFRIWRTEIEEEVWRMKIELENEKRLHEENIKKKQQEKV